MPSAPPPPSRPAAAPQDRNWARSATPSPGYGAARHRSPIRLSHGRAVVSRTFLYENPDARALMEAAGTAHTARRQRDQAAQDSKAEASWRERALNAEDALKAAHDENPRRAPASGSFPASSATPNANSPKTPSSG